MSYRLGTHLSNKDKVNVLSSSNSSLNFCFLTLSLFFSGCGEEIPALSAPFGGPSCKLAACSGLKCDRSTALGKHLSLDSAAVSLAPQGLPTLHRQVQPPSSELRGTGEQGAYSFPLAAGLVTDGAGGPAVLLPGWAASSCLSCPAFSSLAHDLPRGLPLSRSSYAPAPTS